MTLRDKVTEAIPQVPKEKVYSSDYPFYYKDYRDNLFCPMGEQAYNAYQQGSGSELLPELKNGQECPPKMASITSSSAMTFNLLGDGPAVIKGNRLPQGAYQVQYEKQMFTLGRSISPANLDAFLSNEQRKTAIFCEMKMMEYLRKPGSLTQSYFDRDRYFAEDLHTIRHPLNAYEVFQKVIKEIEKADFKRYDAWQMFKHLLAIYSYTSFTTQAAVNKRKSGPSMAGKYSNIILTNVVNEFTLTNADTHTKAEYAAALEEEQMEAKRFIEIICSSDIPVLFTNHCQADFQVQYLSAKEFADDLDMPTEKRDYLKRYFT